MVCQLEHLPQPGGPGLGWGCQPTGPALRVMARVGRGLSWGQLDLLDPSFLGQS